MTLPTRYIQTTGTFNPKYGNFTGSTIETRTLDFILWASITMSNKFRLKMNEISRCLYNNQRVIHVNFIFNLFHATCLFL